MIFIKLHHYILFFICNTWEQRKVSDLLQERNEQTPMSKEYPLMAFIANLGVAPKGERYDRSALVNDEAGKKYKKTEYGDFIYSSNNLEAGSIGLNKYGNACISPVYSIFKPIGKADLDFLGRRFLRKDFINEMVKWRQGVVYGQWKIHESDFLNIEIEVPSVDEQKAIGRYLDFLDHLITLHQRKCDDTKELKKYMLQKMFPKNGEKFPEIRFKGFTEAWEQRKFAAVFDGLQNNTFSRAELNYESGTVKNVHYGDVLIKFGDYIDASETELPYISDDAKADKFKNSFLQDGDIIIADTAEDEAVGKCIEIQGSEGLKLLSGLHTIACRPKGKYGPMFLGYYINSPAYHNQLKPLMQGIKVTSISKSALQDTDMIMPQDIEEQEKIGEYFSNLDHLITLHRRAL